jgi:hypothetical protein
MELSVMVLDEIKTQQQHPSSLVIWGFDG